MWVVSNQIGILLQLVTLETTLRMYWRDPRLRVDHLLNNSNSDYILLHPETSKFIWFPDIYIGECKTNKSFLKPLPLGIWNFRAVLSNFELQILLRHYVCLRSLCAQPPYVSIVIVQSDTPHSELLGYYCYLLCSAWETSSGIFSQFLYCWCWTRWYLLVQGASVENSRNISTFRTAL